jgi:folate-binding protein YgfZ
LIVAQRTPLYESIRPAGAHFEEQGGYLVPMNFGDSTAEYQRTLAGAGLFDQSHRGKLELTGPEAPNFLQAMCTNDVLNLPLGAGCEAFFTTATAKIVDRALIYHTRKSDGHDAIWLDVAPGRAQPLLQHLERYHIAEQFEIADRTAEFGQVHLAGPAARKVLESAMGESIPDLEMLQHMERTIGTTATCHIRRNDPLGVPGYDLVFLAGRAADVWRALLAGGATPAGARAYEVLRIEAGTPLIGQDMDESRFVLEIGRAHAICHTKGCYLGQEPVVMARDRAGHVNRSFRGLKLSEGLAAPKTKLFTEAGQDVGILTSSINSPRFGPIALGYVRRGFEMPGTRLRLGGAAGGEAEVVELPFN